MDASMSPEELDAEARSHRDGSDGKLRDVSEADRFNKLAFDERANAHSMRKLALHPQRGEKGVKKDPARAVQLYERAIAKHSDVDAMRGLAFLLEHGAEGVQKDPVRAVQLYELAIDSHNDVDAMKRLAFLLEHGAEGVQKDPARAVQLYERAIAKHSDVDAMRGLAFLLEHGAEGVQKDSVRAVLLYELAIDSHNDVDAMKRLAFLLKHGAEGVQKDPARAVQLYELAIDSHNDVYAMKRLASLLEDGAEGVQKDPARAVQLYELAIDSHNDVDAMTLLASLLEDGAEGVQKDSARAGVCERWLHEVLDEGSTRDNTVRYLLESGNYPKLKPRTSISPYGHKTTVPGSSPCNVATIRDCTRGDEFVFFEHILPQMELREEYNGRFSAPHGKSVYELLEYIQPNESHKSLICWQKMNNYVRGDPGFVMCLPLKSRPSSQMPIVDLAQQLESRLLPNPYEIWQFSSLFGDQMKLPTEKITLLAMRCAEKVTKFADSLTTTLPLSGFLYCLYDLVDSICALPEGMPSEANSLVMFEGMEIEKSPLKVNHVALEVFEYLLGNRTFRVEGPYCCWKKLLEDGRISSCSDSSRRMEKGCIVVDCDVPIPLGMLPCIAINMNGETLQCLTRKGTVIFSTLAISSMTIEIDLFHPSTVRISEDFLHAGLIISNFQSIYSARIGGLLSVHDLNHSLEGSYPDRALESVESFCRNGSRSTELHEYVQELWADVTRRDEIGRAGRYKLAKILQEFSAENMREPKSDEYRELLDTLRGMSYTKPKNFLLICDSVLRILSNRGWRIWNRFTRMLRSVPGGILLKRAARHVVFGTTGPFPSREELGEKLEEELYKLITEGSVNVGRDNMDRVRVLTRKGLEVYNVTSDMERKLNGKAGKFLSIGASFSMKRTDNIEGNSECPDIAVPTRWQSVWGSFDPYCDDDGSENGALCLMIVIRALCGTLLCPPDESVWFYQNTEEDKSNLRLGYSPSYNAALGLRPSCERNGGGGLFHCKTFDILENPDGEIEPVFRAPIKSTLQIEMATQPFVRTRETASAEDQAKILQAEPA